MMKKVINSLKKSAKKTSSAKTKKATNKKINSGKLLPLIEKRAYELWETRGCVHGYDHHDWCQAEQEIMKKMAKK